MPRVFVIKSLSENRADPLGITRKPLGRVGSPSDPLGLIRGSPAEELWGTPEVLLWRTAVILVLNGLDDVLLRGETV